MGAALDVAKRFSAHMQANDFAALSGCFDPNCRTRTPAGEMDAAEHEGFARAFKDALPDGRMAIDHAVESASGDEVVIEARFLGAHRGDLVGPQGTLLASGNELSLRSADYFRVRDGKIVAHRV